MRLLVSSVVYPLTPDMSTTVGESLAETPSRQCLVAELLLRSSDASSWVSSSESPLRQVARR